MCQLELLLQAATVQTPLELQVTTTSQGDEGSGQSLVDTPQTRPALPADTGAELPEAAGACGLMRN